MMRFFAWMESKMKEAYNIFSRFLSCSRCFFPQLEAINPFTHHSLLSFTHEKFMKAEMKRVLVFVFTAGKQGSREAERVRRPSSSSLFVLFSKVFWKPPKIVSLWYINRSKVLAQTLIKYRYNKTQGYSITSWGKVIYFIKLFSLINFLLLASLWFYYC